MEQLDSTVHKVLQVTLAFLGSLVLLVRVLPELLEFQVPQVHWELQDLRDHQEIRVPVAFLASLVPLVFLANQEQLVTLETLVPPVALGLLGHLGWLVRQDLMVAVHRRAIPELLVQKVRREMWDYQGRLGRLVVKALLGQVALLVSLEVPVIQDQRVLLEALDWLVYRALPEILEQVVLWELQVQMDLWDLKGLPEQLDLQGHWDHHRHPVHLVKVYEDFQERLVSLESWVQQEHLERLVLRVQKLQQVLLGLQVLQVILAMLDQ